MTEHAARRLRPGRTITGISAVLLPYTTVGTPDLDGFRAHLARTLRAGLVPAVNMDTGYAPLLGAGQRAAILRLTSDLCPSGFVAGAHVADTPGDALDLGGYRAAFDTIQAAGGTPIVFPSHGLAAVPDDEWVKTHAALAESADRFYAFELGQMFHPAGRVVGLDAFAALLEIDACVGAKHSSLSRTTEWERLAVRDEFRPDFAVLTGNDLAIDMVMYGSDYLLGLSTFAPEAFARRDRYWARGDDRFFELNDVLQAIGSFAFRDPVPAYRHDAALFLKLRGWIDADATHPDSPTRPETDREVLATFLDRLLALDPDLA